MEWPAQEDASGGHFEIEVEGEERKSKVGRPGGDGWGELADAAHGFHERGDGPIEDTDADTGGHAADGAPAADDNGERDSEQHADGRDQRVGQFFLPLHSERRCIETGAAQTLNVATEVTPAHLESLNHFAIEIRRRLSEFGEAGNHEGRVVRDGAAGEIADPAGFKDPGFFVVEPTGAVGKHAAANLESGGIEFDDA